MRRKVWVTGGVVALLLGVGAGAVWWVSFEGRFARSRGR
jgi:hypothetical protein